MQLSDEAVYKYLTDGYIVIQPERLGDDFHQALWHEADKLYAAAGLLKSKTAHLDLLGDNLTARVPRVNALLADPAVAGAIESILGEDAFLHPHNFVHESTTKDQPFHQDGNLPWNERGHYRSHRPDWLILLYYPQEVTAANGPTEIIPNSQYWTVDIELPDGDWHRGDFMDPDLTMETLAVDDLNARDHALTASLEGLGIPQLERKFIEVPAGSVLIGNYDLIHRGSRKILNQASRYMYKFYFARTHEPTSSTWQPVAETPSLKGLRKDLCPVVESHWAWMRGGRLRRSLNMTDLHQAVHHLGEGRENEKIAAAYQLGMDTSSLSLAELAKALRHLTESTRRAAAYGLRLRSDEATDVLQEASREQRVSVRRFATFAMGAFWSDACATVSLIERLELDPDDLTRSNAAYALGQLARNPKAHREQIFTALVGRLKANIEPDNTEIAGLPRSTIRQSAAYGLLQLAANHRLDTASRNTISELINTESDRYVLGMLIEVLAYDSEDQAVIRALARRRYSSL